MGVALQDRRLAGRGTRFLIYTGLVAAVAAAVVFALTVFPTEVRMAYNQHVAPQVEKLGEHRPTVQAGLLGLGGLLVWLWYVRLVSGARRAIREWLEANSPGG
jgi:hypothetical protein